MKTKPSVAIIVMNFNGMLFLDESLGSLSKQTYSNYHIYLADAVSTDNSVSYVKSKYPHVTVLEFKNDPGVPGLYNLAANRTTEEYLYLVSNDMDFNKNALENLMETLLSSKSNGVVSSVLLKHKPFETDHQYHVDNAGFDMDLFGFIYPHFRDVAQNKLPQTPFETFAICGGSFVISRKLFNKIHGFDGSYWQLNDDVDLAWRVRIAGFKVVVDPRSFLYHHISPTLSRIKRPTMRYTSEKNILTNLLKNYSLLNLLWVLPLYLILEVAESIYHLLHGDPKLTISIYKALWWNIKTFASIMERRKYIQSIRQSSDSVVTKHIHKGSYKINMLLPAPETV